MGDMEERMLHTQHGHPLVKRSHVTIRGMLTEETLNKVLEALKGPVYVYIDAANLVSYRSKICMLP